MIGLHNYRPVVPEKMAERGFITTIAIGQDQDKSIGQLDNCYCRHLTSLPESISQLESLKKLDLSICWRSTSLPEFIGQLKNLEELNLSWCHTLTSLPESVGQLENLVELNLFKCRRLITLPESIGQLEKLEKLNASGCTGVTSLPESIGQLKLEKLDLSHSGLKSLPECIEQLKNLVKLDLSNCQLKEPPHFIYEIHPELVVGMEGNPITLLSQKFVKVWENNPAIRMEDGFQNMEGLDLSKLQQPPQSVFRKGLEACVKYYCSLCLKCKMLNVTVLGNTGAGKSSQDNTARKSKLSGS